MKTIKETTWNYRVLVTKIEDDYVYSIREVYYQGNKPTAWTESESSPFGLSLEEIKNDVEMMEKAFEKPPLLVKGDELVEFKG